MYLFYLAEPLHCSCLFTFAYKPYWFLQSTTAYKKTVHDAKECQAKFILEFCYYVCKNQIIISGTWYIFCTALLRYSFALFTVFSYYCNESSSESLWYSVFHSFVTFGKYWKSFLMEKSRFCLASSVALEFENVQTAHFSSQKILKVCF